MGRVRLAADGDTAEASCEVACTACGKCVMDSGPGVMKLENNLAVVDYARNEKTDRKAIERCPTGAIVWFDNPNFSIKGAEAKRILRQNELPVISA